MIFLIPEGAGSGAVTDAHQSRPQLATTNDYYLMYEHGEV